MIRYAARMFEEEADMALEAMTAMIEQSSWAEWESCWIYHHRVDDANPTAHPKSLGVLEATQKRPA
jgi:hypothetical protein